MALPRAERSSVPLTPTINFQSIRGWRQACRATHGACCNNDYSDALAESIDQLMLVDVISGSLIILPTSPPIKYVALSYVWGNAPMFKTTTTNIEVLLQSGALYETCNNIVLPDTVRDAIHLVRALGERYLWVDCLCVVQDASSEEMNATLRAMARIYTSAEFTVVAADGKDAGHGLRGIGGPSTNRDPDPSSSPRLWDAYPGDSKWATRGWTFQESLFSRRLLIFGDTVSWICGRCQWREGVDELASAEDIHDPETTTTLGTANGTWPAERPHLGIPMGMMSLIPTIPSLGRWGMLVEDFSSRDLTYEKDTQAAFAGATEVMDATFPDGLLHGMPRFFFDIALLWLPTLHLRRREGEPSWSWTGWKDGAVDCLSAWYPFYAAIFRDTEDASDWVSIATLAPVAKYRMEDPLDEADQKFNGFYQYQALLREPDEKLPAGWNRHGAPDGDYFTHTDTSQSTKYPFPLPIVNPTQRRLHIPSSPILRCLAQYAELTFGYMIPCDEAHRKVMTLTDGRETVGNIVLMCDIYNSEHLQGSVCELIAISKAKTSLPRMVARRGWPVTAWERYSKELKSVTGGSYPMAYVYNVMWIERVGDVVERRGLGMVEKLYWDALRPETKEFRLG